MWIKILWKEKIHLRENRPIFWGIWGEEENTFRELRNFYHQCIIFRGQGSTDPGGGGLEDENIFYCVALLCSVRQLNIIIKESFTTLHEPRFSAHDKSRKFHGFKEITENLFYMKWAASFVIFEIYVRILTLKHHFFNFTRGKFRVFRQSVKYP